MCNRAILRDLFEKENHSSVNFHGDPKSGLEIKNFLVDMPFLGGWPYTHTQDRVEKSCSARMRD